MESGKGKVKKGKKGKMKSEKSPAVVRFAYFSLFIFHFSFI